MPTRTSATSGNWRADNADTWGLGADTYPAAGDHVVVAAGHNVTLGENNECATFTQQASGDGSGDSTLTLASHTLTISGINGSNSRVIDIGNANCNLADNTGTIKLAGGTTATYDLQGIEHWADELQNVLIDASANTPTYELQGAMTVNGNLTITDGVLTTLDGGTSHALTVTGHVSVTGTLTGNASTITIGSLKITSGGTYSATSGTTFVLSELSSSGFAFDSHSSGTFTHNNGTVSIGNGTTAAETHLMENTFYNLIINSNSDTKLVVFRPKSGSTVTVANDLTMTRGVLYRNNVNDTFTVTRDVSVTSGSTLGRTNDTGASNFGSLTIASGGTHVATSGTTTITGIVTGAGPTAYSQSGTFTHNGGTIKFDYAGNQKILATTSFNNLIIDGDGGTKEFQALTIAGDLDVTASDTFKSDNGTEALTVGGGVDVSGILGSGETGAFEFGGIRINSGGTYNATSGTTTVTNRFTGTSNLWKNDGGTFNHNNGTVKFTDNDHSLIKELTFYNLEAASSLGDYALSWETSSGTACTILGDLTITRGDFEIHAAGNTLDVYGQTIINGASNSGARFNNDKNQTGTITHHGLVTIIQGTYHVEDGGTVNMAGIRNVGGLVD